MESLQISCCKGFRRLDLRAYTGRRSFALETKEADNELNEIGPEVSGILMEYAGSSRFQKEGLEVALFEVSQASRGCARNLQTKVRG